MRRRDVILVVITGIIVLLACAGVWKFINVLRLDSRGTDNWCSPQQYPYQDPDTCKLTLAKQFREVDYAETKDLLKAFLTLVVAVFVGSVTFSEKIVNFKTAGRISIVAMLACWLLLLVAIIMAGWGLSYEYIAMLQSTRGSSPYGLAFYAEGFSGVAGVAFVASLLAMFIAGLPSIFPEPKDATVEQSLAENRVSAPSDDPIEVPRPH